ncbi:MAG: NAD-dependent epimerase/dehydratase family protein [bacterium]|nr:NAD-dependent epimerase/dehydratase family protein [bacterium]
MKKKRVLVCGASGFLGYNIFRLLATRGDLDVHGTYLTNRYGRLDPYQLADAHLFHASNLTREERVRNLIKNYGPWDIIVQMAANTSGAKDVENNPAVHITDNIAMNNWIFRAAHDYHVPQVIFPSCTVMYPNSEVPLKETDLDLNEAFYPKYFGGAWMKIYCEKLCEFYSRLGRTKYTVIRHSNIYGPHDRFDPERSHVFGATVRKISETEDGGKIIVWGHGREVRDFLYVSDFIHFVRKLIDQQDDNFDIFNLGSEESVSIKELVERMVRISGKKLEIVYDPHGPTMGTKISISAKKARDRFAWMPQINLDTGIRMTLSWHNENIKNKER